MPSRKPDGLKALQGTLRPCRVNKNAPKGVPGIPKCSRELAAPVRREYMRLVRTLEDMSILTLGDKNELESLAIARAQVLHLQEKLFKVTDPKDFRKLQIALNDSIRLGSSLAAKFGLNPSDRGRVSVVPGKPKKNRWDKSEGEESEYANL